MKTTTTPRFDTTKMNGHAHSARALKAAATRNTHRRQLGAMKLLTGILAAIGAGFLPAASYGVIHYQCPAQPLYWLLALAGLAYSAPTVMVWARTWARLPWGSASCWVKAGAFTAITEGTLAFGLPWMAYTALAILVGINMTSAYKAATAQ